MRAINVEAKAYSRHATVFLGMFYRLLLGILGCSIIVLLIRPCLPLSAQVPRATLTAEPVVLAAEDATCLQLQHVPPFVVLRFASGVATRRRVRGDLALRPPLGGAPRQLRQPHPSTCSTQREARL